MAERPGGRGRRWRWVIAFAGLLVAVGVVAGFRLIRMSRDLSTVRDQLEAAAEAIEDGRLADARTELDAAADQLVDINSALYRAPDLRLLGLLPAADDNLHAIRELVDVTLELSARTMAVLEPASAFETDDGTLEISLQGGAVPLGAVADVEEELGALLPALRLPPGFGERSTFVLPQITDAQARIAEIVDERRRQVADLDQGLTMIEEMLGGNGDRRYLLAVANTAEMRGSGGMYLSYGVLQSSDGDLEVGAFGGIDELFLGSAVDAESLGVPPDELARWGSLEPTRLWRNVNLVPDFDEVAPRAMAMFEAATGLPVDGVIQIDPDGLAAMLRGIGPVQVEGLGTVTAENVVALTINEAYVLFPDRDQRQEVLGDVAEAVFRRLADGDYPSLRPLGEALYQSVLERHILFTSPRSDVQDAIAHFSTAGVLPPPTVDHLLLTTQNRGRDKLDYYLDTAVQVRGERPPGEPGRLEVTVTLTNTAPPGVEEPAYIFGGDDERIVPRGTYAGIASLYVPNGTRLGAEPGPGIQLAADSGRTVVGWDVLIPAGGTRTITVELLLPPAPDEPTLTLAPIPRVRPTTWDVDVVTEDGAGLRRTGPLLVTEQLRPGSEPVSSS